MQGNDLKCTAITRAGAKCRVVGPYRATKDGLRCRSIGLLFSLLEVHPKHLRRLGWSLVAGNVAAFLALTVGLS